MRKNINNRLRNTLNWIFETKTRPGELFSGVTAFFFAIVMMIDYNVIVLRESYATFGELTTAWLWLAILILAVLQVAESTKDSLISNQRSAQLALWFSLIWCIIAILFASNYPPLSTGFFTYMIFSIANFITYFYIDGNNQTIIKETRND